MGHRVRLSTSDIVEALVSEYGVPCTAQGVYAALQRHLRSAKGGAWAHKSKQEGTWVWQITKAGEEHILAHRFSGTEADQQGEP